jgi:hypothetical protein
VGDVPTAREMKPYVRGAAQMAAGIPTGIAASIPAGAAAGALAGAGVDLLYGDTPKVTDVGGDFLGGMAIPYAGKALLGAAKKLIPAPLENKIANTIREGFEKGVRPSVVGKGNARQVEDYYGKAKTAVESIIGNKPSLQFTDEMGNLSRGRLPETLQEFSSSVDQTKRNLFSKYNDMLLGSNLRGRTVDLSNISKELSSFSSDPVVRMTGGGGINRANELSSEMRGKQLTLVQAQDLLANLNNRTSAYLKNPSPDHVSTFAADLLAANNLRRALDTAVESSGYMGLRTQYGSLREVEKEVTNRALVDARKNVKGLIDFTDIFTAAEVAKSLASMNPVSATGAGAMAGMKALYKYLNNPNRIIKSMFSDVENLMGKRPVGSKMKALPPGPTAMGSGIPDQSGITVTTGPPLYQKELPRYARPMGSGIPDRSGLLRGGQEIVHGEPTNYYDMMWNKQANLLGGQEYIPPETSKIRPYLRKFR